MVTRVHEPGTSRAAATRSCFGQGIGSWKKWLKSERCEITSFLKTHPDPEAGPQLRASGLSVQWVGPGQAALRSPN